MTAAAAWTNVTKHWHLEVISDWLNINVWFYLVDKFNCKTFNYQMNGMMDSYVSNRIPNLPPNSGHSGSSNSNSTGGIHSSVPKPPRNFKLLTDSALSKGAIKVYRYDGVVPNDPTYPPVIPRDPRNPLVRIRARPQDPIVLTVPRLVNTI